MTFEFTMIGISFINTINNKGPKIESCGTPDFTSVHFDSVPHICTACFLLDTNAYFETIYTSTYVLCIIVHCDTSRMCE